MPPRLQDVNQHPHDCECDICSETRAVQEEDAADMFDDYDQPDETEDWT